MNDEQARQHDDRGCVSSPSDVHFAGPAEIQLLTNKSQPVGKPPRPSIHFPQGPVLDKTPYNTGSYADCQRIQKCRFSAIYNAVTMTKRHQENEKNFGILGGKSVLRSDGAAYSAQVLKSGGSEAGSSSRPTRDHVSVAALREISPPFGGRNPLRDHGSRLCMLSALL